MGPGRKGLTKGATAHSEYSLDFFNDTYLGYFLLLFAF